MTRWTDTAYAEAGLLPSAQRRPIPLGPQDAASVIDAALERTPDAEALVGRHARFSYRALDAEVNAAAAALGDLGVVEGTRVAASAANHTDIVVAFLAVQRLGAIWVGINRNQAPPERQFLLTDCGASVYLADRQTVEQVMAFRSAVPSLAHVVSMEPGERGGEWAALVRAKSGASRPAFRPEPWAPAAIAYTSGTTGRPKGAVHSQHNMMVAASAGVIGSGGARAGVRIGSALPLTILNLMIREMLAALSVGGTHVCMDRIDALGVADWVRREQINSFGIVPTVVHDLLTLPEIDPADLASLTSLVVGAAAVPEALPGLYRERFGRRMKIGYGLTENPAGVASTHEQSPNAPGVIGRAYPHLRVAILDDAGREVASGDVGEICVRAVEFGEWADVYTPTLGYWGNAAGSAELLRDGWLHTGDLGRRDTQGDLYIEGRRGDLIIRGGANIYPAEVERVLAQDPRVTGCAVLGKPDVRLGEVVVAFVEAAPDAARGELEAALRAACARELAAYKMPAEWRFVDSLPRNAMNKIVRARLREQLADVQPQRAA